MGRALPIDVHALQPGDILACWGGDLLSRVVSLGTCWPVGPTSLWLPPSHVAVICDYRDQPCWVESTTLCRHSCLVSGKPIEGVQAHLPELRIDDYLEHGGRVELYRLSPIDSLSSAESDLLTRILFRYLVGRVRYDKRRAALSGSKVFWLMQSCLPRSSREEMFCSQLIARLLMRLNRLNRANPAWYNPGRLLRRVCWDGTYERVGVVDGV